MYLQIFFFLAITTSFAASRTYVGGKLSPTCVSEDECTCQTYSSCILAKNYTQSQKLHYIDCLASVNNTFMKTSIKKCVEKVKIPWNDVEQCYKNGEGFEALKKFNEIQHSYDKNITHVPFLVFNGVVDDEVDDNARDDFWPTMCDYLNNEPLACRISKSSEN